MKRKNGGPVGQRLTPLLWCAEGGLPLYYISTGEMEPRVSAMKSSKRIVLAILLFGLVAALTICIMSSACSAQSGKERKDGAGGDRKRDEPKREERSKAEPSRERATEREPARERGETSGGDRTARSGGADREARDSGRTGNRPKGTDADDRRSGTDRGGGSSAEGRTRPPVEPNDRTYDRRRGDDTGAGLRPRNGNPPIRPPRSYPEDDADGGTRKKDVPVPDDRIRIITRGWPYPPPWHREYVRIRYAYPGFPEDDPYLIHLPFGTIRPGEIEDEFIDLLHDLWRDGMEDALLVCIVQTYRPLDADRFALFFDAEDDATVYGSFSAHSFLALLSVYTIFELIDDPRIRWIGEYEPRYKVNRSTRLWEYDGALVFPLEGDGIECRDDLADIYLVPEFYDEELGFYFVPAEEYELEAISEFWWVAEVVRVVDDPDLVSGYRIRSP